LQAHNFYEQDVAYVIKEGKVIIVDEFTGRLMPGRRWSDGLHQAIEAKEGLKIEQENQTLATITFQNYFRMYEKLAGMTGTAYTEASEFKAIYKLDVVTVPTNQPLIRKNFPDCIYKTEQEKFNAVVEEIARLHAHGQPVLVGTISIEKSERLSLMLKKKGIPHQVLNAKYHESEAQIVAQAGRYKAVTIATNMAGRGTDILLGGNYDFMAKNILKQRQQAGEEFDFTAEFNILRETYKKDAETEHVKVVEAGGLHVLGTERHEARRIDNQLRGRSGRQGDPGSSRFYVSLADDLMRLFGSDRLVGMMSRLGFEDGQVIEHPWITKSIEVAQRRVEQHNFEIRKQLLEYDNVMNKQREVIYDRRREILEGASLKDDILTIIGSMVDDSIAAHHIGEDGETKKEHYGALINEIRFKFGLNELEGLSLPEDAVKDEVREIVYKALVDAYETKEKNISSEIVRQMERMVFLQIIDTKWKDHLYAMDKLREGIGLRAYGQRDPLIEYKKEAYGYFSQMMSGIEEEAAEMVFKLQPVRQERIRGVFSSVSQEMVHPDVEKIQGSAETAETSEPKNQENKPVASAQAKVGRNDPCPCGSGKKFKKCCGTS